MAPPTKRLGEILIEAGLIDEFQVNAALTEQKRWGGKLGEHLVKLGYVTEDALLDTLRNQLKIPTVNLTKVRIPPEVLNLLPQETVKKHKCLPVGVKTISGKDHLVIAMSDPTNLGALDDLQFATKLKLLPAIAGPITLDRAIRFYYDQQGDLFSDADDPNDAFSPTSVRSRMDMVDGSRTVEGSEISHESPAATLFEKAKAAGLTPGAGRGPMLTPVPGPGALAAPAESGKVDLAQLRAEVTALRDLLLEKGLLDKRSFVEIVNRLRTGKTS